MNNNTVNIATEAEVLGKILFDNNSIAIVSDFLFPKDFYSSQHQTIYTNMLTLYSEGKPIDITTLSNQIGNNLSDVGGITYLAKILSSACTSTDIKVYAEILKEKSYMRSTMNIFQKGLLCIEKENIKSEEIIEKSINYLYKINNTNIADSGELTPAIMDYIVNLENRWRNGGDTIGIKWGHDKLDSKLGNLMPQDFVILAARPSMGKTSVALNIAINSAIVYKSKIAFFNLEMGKQQILERSISMLTNISMDKLKTGNIKDEDYGVILNASNSLSTSSLKIYDKIYTLSAIKNECRRLKMKQGLDLVIIDYLQLIDSCSQVENRNESISTISRSLKLLAKELDITVLALSQLSRAPETRSNHRPILSDLRDSGSIEQDADMVIFLYRDEYYNPDDTSTAGIMEFIISKYRNGSIGTLRFNWQPECQKFL